MKTSKFREGQILRPLKENQQGRRAGEISRELGIDGVPFTIGVRNTGGRNNKSLSG